jgi:hypothetical protein
MENTLGMLGTYDIQRFIYISIDNKEIDRYREGLKRGGYGGFIDRAY